MDQPIPNRVDASGIITLDLHEFFPKEKSVFLDLKDFLYQGLIIREKEFKETASIYNWEIFRGKPVGIGCSVETIIPTWVYLNLACYLEGLASHSAFCTAEELDLQRWLNEIEQHHFEYLRDKKVVVRAGSNINPTLYLAIARKLKPLVKTLMYGEAGLPKVIWKN